MYVLFPEICSSSFAIMATLAEKLAALSNPAPEFEQESEEEDNVTGAKVTEGDYDQDDVPGERSYLRTVNAPNLDDDARYKGKKIKRKDFQKDRDFMEHSEAELGHMFDFGGDDEDDEEEEEDDDDDDDDDEDIEDQEMEEGDETEIQSNEDEEDDSDEEEEEKDFGMDISNFAAEPTENLQETEAEGVKITETDSLYSKGKAVTGQLGCWDKLLEQRILLQKILTKVNRFPTDVESFVDPEDTEHVDLIKQAKKALSKSIHKSVNLKNTLENKAVEDCDVMGSGLDEMRSWLERDFESGRQARRERISMWSERTQKLGSMAAMNTPTLEQIEQITANMDRLVKRTQVSRLESDILDQEDPAASEKMENENIFDDSDFYHHLLREIIEKKTAVNSEQGQVGQHWLQIQKLRSKLKKKVDTRASKGRKVRYDVHTKLVNFMAPVRLSDPMNDAARQELFSSLFGARKS